MELSSRNGRPLTRYFPELVDSLAAALPDRCVVDGEILIALGGGSGLRGAAPAHPPGPSPASSGWPPRPRRHSSRSTCWPRATRTSAGGPSPSVGPGLETLLAGCGPGNPVRVTPQTTDVATGRRLAGALRGGRARRGGGQVARALLSARQAGDVEDQARADGRMRGGRLPRTTSRAGVGDRSSSASTTTSACCATLGSARGSARSAEASWSTSWRRSRIFVGENTSKYSEGYTHAIVVLGEDQAALDAYRKDSLHEEAAHEIDAIEEVGVGVDFADGF
jgi:hypothetical protein